MINHVTAFLLDLMVQQYGGVMPALLLACHTVPRTNIQVAQLGRWHLHGWCTGANKTTQWQGMRILLGRKSSTKTQQEITEQRPTAGSRSKTSWQQK